MYDELVKALRDMSKMGMKYGMAAVKMREAADAIEELMRRCEQFQYTPPPAWIPVTEMLPESGQRVLAVGLHGEAMFIGTYTGGIKETAYRKAKPHKINAGGYGWRSFTWWMPVPQPPKEVNADGQ